MDKHHLKLIGQSQRIKTPNANALLIYQLMLKDKLELVERYVGGKAPNGNTYHLHYLHGDPKGWAWEVDSNAFKFLMNFKLIALKKINSEYGGAVYVAKPWPTEAPPVPGW